jgi:putative intracellular protease/amidase
VLKNVAVVILDGFTPFELGVACEVFGVDRRDDGLPAYDFAVVAGESGPLRSAGGFTVQTPFGLERLEEADLVVISAVADERIPRAGGDYPEPLLAALRQCAARGAHVLSVCTGAFVLGAAGLLDDRRCTTHWRHAAGLAAMFPAAKVDPDVLYVDEGPVITSAGTAAGIDACLHLIRREQGSRVANGIARRMVVPPHRDGGQAQYVERTLTELAGRAPGRAGHGRPAGGAGVHVAADLRPAVRPGDRDHAAALADRPADPGRAAAAGGDRRDGRRGRGAVRVRQRRGAAAPLPGLAVDDAAGLPERFPRPLGQDRRRE